MMTRSDWEYSLAGLGATRKGSSGYWTEATVLGLERSSSISRKTKCMAARGDVGCSLA